MHGRALYVEADFLNPMIGKLMPSRSIAPRWSNEWITGEVSLDESCRDVSGMFDLAPSRLYFLLANPSEGARRRIEVLDAEGDKRILETLEGQDWVVNRESLDYVVIDTPPWMHYILACISYISNNIIYVVRPSMYELSILEDRIENIYSNFVCLVNPAINMYDSRNESMKRFEEKLRDLRSEMYSRFNDLRDEMNNRFREMNDRFNTLDRRFDGLNSRFDSFLRWIIGLIFGMWTSIMLTLIPILLKILGVI
jgi:cellulose biosynthesis protein BcsQ